MKTFKYLLMISLMSIFSLPVAAQSNSEAPSPQAYADDIDDMQEELSTKPTAEGYVQLAEEIYMLNSIYPEQQAHSCKLRNVMTTINKAIALDSNNARLYAIRGEYQRDVNGDLSAAIDDLDRAVELELDNPDWYLQRGSYKDAGHACKDDWTVCDDLGSEACENLVAEYCNIAG